jgi:hypothetical protein
MDTHELTGLKPVRIVPTVADTVDAASHYKVCRDGFEANINKTIVNIDLYWCLTILNRFDNLRVRFPYALPIPV